MDNFNMSWDDIRNTDEYKNEWEGFTDDIEGWSRFWEKLDRERADEQIKEIPDMENKEISKIQTVIEAFSLADVIYKYYDGKKHKDDCLYAALNLIENNDIECFKNELFN
jgi:hypothetical protein